MQVVELLKKNPAVAVPVVLARLKQKDEEWCELLPLLCLLCRPRSRKPRSMLSDRHYVSAWRQNVQLTSL